MSKLVESAVLLSKSGISNCPAIPGEKRPIGAWADLQEAIINPDDVPKLYANAERIGIITGRISGGKDELTLESIDYDDMAKYREMPEEVRNFMKARTYMEKSPHGVHVIYRYPCEGKPDGNQKLASPPGKEVKAWIETRGEGGYLVVAPSPGYEAKFGDLSSPGVITREERDWLINECRKLDQSTTNTTAKASPSSPVSPSPVSPSSPAIPLPAPFTPVTITTLNEPTPQEEYNKRAELNGIASLLERHGWKFDRIEGGNEHWTRPGADKVSGTSATWNGKVFYVFSTSCSLEAGQGYSAFYVYAHYEHGGDLSAAALALEAQGVGKLAKAMDASGLTLTIPTVQIEESEPIVPENDESFHGPSWAEVMEAIKGSPLEVYIQEVSNSIGNLSQEIPLMQSILLAGLCMANNGSNMNDGTHSVLSNDDLQPIRMNVYGMSLCSSGAGKGLTSGFLRSMMEMLALPKLRGNSEAALVNQCNEGAMYGLFHASEIVKLMSAKNVVAVGICNCMLEAFNAGEVWWVTNPAGKAKTIIVKPAAPSFLVEGQPDVFEKVCHDSNMSSGFLARFLTAMSKKPRKSRVRRTGTANHGRVFEAYSVYKSFPSQIIRPVYEMSINEDVYAMMDDPARSSIDKLSGEYIPKIACMLNPTVSKTGRVGIDEMRRADVICKWFATRSIEMFGLIHDDVKEVKRARMQRKIFEIPGIDQVSLYKSMHVSVEEFKRDYAPSVLARGDVECKKDGRFTRWYPKGSTKPFQPSMITPMPDPTLTPPVVVPVPAAPVSEESEKTSEQEQEDPNAPGYF